MITTAPFSFLLSQVSSGGTRLEQPTAGQNNNNKKDKTGFEKIF